MRDIKTNDSLSPSGHYSQGIIHNDTVYISNQLSIDPATGEQLHSTPFNETLNILRNMEIILKRIDLDRFNIIKSTVYITDMDNWTDINEAYIQFFKDHKPVRTILPVSSLHHGFKVGIECVAVME